MLRPASHVYHSGVGRGKCLAGVLVVRRGGWLGE